MKEASEEEEMTTPEVGLDRWMEYTRLSGRGNDFRSFTNFGSVRLDHDNTARTPDFPTEKFGKVFSEQEEREVGVETEISHNLGLFVGEQDEKYNKFTAFKATPSKHKINTESFLDKIRPSESDPRQENKTIPPNPSEAGTEDLNYVDSLLFKDSLVKFDSDQANLAREVTVDPSVQMMREQTAEPELNYFDKKYFTPPVPVTDSLEDHLTTPPSPSVGDVTVDAEDLNSIDDQYFKVALEPVQSRLHPSVAEVPEETSDTKVIMALSELDKLDKEKPKKPKKKKQKDQVRLSTEGTALEYVRELRKEMAASPAELGDPGQMIGKSLQDRFLAAASNLQSRSVNSWKTKEDVDEEEEQQQNVTENNVKKFKPPDLEKYTRTEVRDLLFSKIIFDKHDIVAIWKPYGLPMFLTGSGSVTSLVKRGRARYSLECFKAELASKVGAETLHEVHRLDSTTTGVVLYAKTKEMELKLRKMFSERKVRKNYLAICNGTPQTESGVIDIPLGEAKVDNKMRMTLRPDYRSSTIISNKKTVGKSSETAITNFKVISIQMFYINI